MPSGASGTSFRMTMVFVPSEPEHLRNHTLSLGQPELEISRPGVDLDVEGAGIAGRVRARPAVPLYVLVR